MGEVAREDLQALEEAMCREDRMWLIERHFVIHNKSGRLQRLNPMRQAQRRALKTLDARRKQNLPARLIIGKSRKKGLSTAIAADAFCEYLLNDINVMVIAHEKDLSETILAIMHRFYEFLDQEYEKGIVPIRKPKMYKGQTAKDEIRFDGYQGKIWIGTAKNTYAGTGMTPQYIFASEVSKWDTGSRTAISLLQSVAYKPGTTVVYECTFNGEDSLFYPTWRKAYDYCDLRFDEHDNPTITVKDDGKWNYFVPMFTGASDDPDIPIPFQSEAEAARFATTLTEEEQMWREKFSCSLELLHGMRVIKANQCQGKDDIRAQEYCMCVHPMTMVSTNRGIIPVIVAQKGDITESGIVERLYFQEPSPIYKLTTTCGRELIGTADHPVALDDGGFCGIAELKPGQKIKLRSPRFADEYYTLKLAPLPVVSITTTINEDWGYFIGMFMGDGCYFRGNISVCCDGKDTDVVEFYASLINKILGTAPTRTTHIRKKGSLGAIELRTGCAKAKEIFKELYLIHKNDGGLGSYVRMINVPPCIFRSPKPVVGAFLSALFECDGSASGEVVRFGSSKLNFVREVQLLLLGFGITSRIKKSQKWAGNMKYRYTFYALELGVLNSLKFHDQIGFIGNRKKSLRSKSTGEKSNCWYNNLIDEVESVESIGDSPTFDFTVSGEHVFSANGILTHNTPEEAIVASGAHRFNIQKLNFMQAKYQETGERGELYYSDRWDKRILFRRDVGGYMVRFREPKPTHRYVIGCDTAEGRLDKHGEEQDSTVADVYDLDNGMEQVAIVSGNISSENIIQPLAMLGEYYNRAFIVIENNSSGSHTCVEMGKIYPRERLYHSGDVVQDSQKRLSREIGFKTTIGTKGNLIGNLAEAVETEAIIFHNEKTYDEMRHYVKKAGGGTEAAAGYHDDHVIGPALAVLGAQSRPVMLDRRQNADDIERYYQMPKEKPFQSGRNALTGY